MRLELEIAEARDVASAHEHPPALGSDEAGHGLQDQALSGRARADQAVETTLRHLERNLSQDRAIEALFDAFERDQRLA